MRVLTKSRFKLGLECPNKLFYTNKKEYANTKVSDPFLEALAQGGFQVEEYARMHFPNGVLIEGDDWDYEKLWTHTQELLEQENIIIYEAAFLIDGLFIRTDILVKKGDNVQLIEVKSKSYDPADENIFIGKRGGMVSGWKPYLFDIAFQKHVMQLCFPDWDISSNIMMANKSKFATIDGMNQLFRISKSVGNRTGITKSVESIDKLGESVLGQLKIDDIVSGIESNAYLYHEKLTFQEAINLFKEIYKKDEYIKWPTSYSLCKKCEFKSSMEDESKGLKSGFKECFEKQHSWSGESQKGATILEIGDFRKGGQLLEDGVLFMKELTKEMIGFKEGSNGLSLSERHWLQIQKEVTGDDTAYIDIDGLKNEMDGWVYPLHFIDFETSAVALPFNKGRKPYEQIAFQFSHHTYHEDGRVKHADEFINSEPGYFPNFDFIRDLRSALSKDKGTIFRYSHHENTILNAIYEQLVNSNETDKDDLISFIQSISHSKGASVVKWKGDRDMVDLWDMVKKFYYSPLTKGSNSIKDILPAVLDSSAYLQEKYSEPIGKGRISSKNFSEEHIWIKIVDAEVINPYKTLPPVFQDWSEEQIEHTLSEIEDIANGGAALTAYAKLQYSDMDKAETEELTKALLKYCELDTLAMVMIYEHFRELVIHQ